MYLINKEVNRISSVQQKNFTELGFKERAHLQEWIAYNPKCLGEELLIIQKEFDGFDDTRERLDLLALDKHGNLVIIENKLDDTGRDVTWQSLKYASYCSSLSKNQIKDIYQKYLDTQGIEEKAEDKIIDFFDNIDYEDITLNSGQSQRIIMVAGSFRKEVTSTVLWLMNYKLNIKCIKVTPYQLGEQLFLDLRQIIPIKEAEEYTIKMAEKSEEENVTKNQITGRYSVRLEFWNKLLKVLKEKENFNLFSNINPSKDNYIGASSSIANVAYIFRITKEYVRVELCMYNPNKEFNEFIFDTLKQRKEEIETRFGKALEWERREDIKSSYIIYKLENVNIFNRDDWDKMIEFLVENMIKLEEVFRPILKEVKEELKNKDF
ncbi:DUF4268 domain-containing protein [Hathewaya massiliensis]|uniref:DUF4268 domain-containing protein n=1 Tax=Hathewaya massiliensis TaxID=1964382 RepID=UPI00115AEF3D|nr:DUF4268 domain-containing protein [Hathewaya massiliensis]